MAKNKKNFEKNRINTNIKALSDRWESSPIALYAELQDVMNNHIAKGYSPSEFPYEVVAPTFDYLKSFFQDFKFEEDEMRVTYQDKISQLIKDIELCKNGIDQDMEDWRLQEMGREKIPDDTVNNKTIKVKYPYNTSLLLIEECIDTLDRIYLYRIIKNFLETMKVPFLDDTNEKVRIRILTLDLYENIEKIWDKISIKEPVENLYLIEQLIPLVNKLHTEITNNIVICHENLFLLKNKLPRLEFSTSSRLNSLQLKKNKNYKSLPPGVALLLPLINENSSLEFFNKTSTAPLYLLAISLKRKIIADGELMTP